VRFDGLARYRTDSPVELAADLQRQNKATADALRQLEQERAAKPKPRVVAAAATAAFDEFLLVDSSTGSVNVLLPRPTTADEGRSVHIGRKSASNSVTAIASGGASVNGGASVTLTASIGYRTFTLADGDWYGHHT
jgi:hypothetical protein